jgi:hypothetical protein
MDFSNRNVQSQAPAPAGQAPAAGTSGRRKSDKGKLARFGIAAAVAAVVILLISVVTLVSFSDTKSEDDYVDSTKLQAVFLNTGQVYFGKIQSLNSKYVVLSNIYYLQTSNSGTGTTAAANANVSLVKLGCELHHPYDRMVINRDQVTFWENLGDNGQVAKAVADFVKQNPQGQKCADQSTSSSTNSGNTTQNAGSRNP